MTRINRGLLKAIWNSDIHFHCESSNIYFIENKSITHRIKGRQINRWMNSPKLTPLFLAKCM